MNTQKLLTLGVSLLAMAFLTSCGSKTSTPGAVDQNSTRVVIDATKALASCVRTPASAANFNFNVATVVDSNGETNPDWVKVKFSYLSSDVTQTGYTLRFFKWRVVGTSTQLDSNAIEFSTYNLLSKQVSPDSETAIFTNQINSQTGFYLKLNDDVEHPYQVLKVVAYKTDGTVLAQSDILIPEFLASPEDYKINADGSARSLTLQKLHPLYGTDVSQWSSDQLTGNFQQYCF